MLNIRSVIAQLKEEDYNAFAALLNTNKAEKLSVLLQLLRTDGISDEKIMEELKVNSSAFYTLKSRLNDKIQEFIIHRMEGPKLELLRKVAHIPTLIFNTDKDIAISALTRLEKDLIGFDMPGELITVYNALRKLHFNTPKYYDYTQAYNKQIAYTVAMNKVEERMLEFNRKLADYFLSRDKSSLELLSLMKQEINNTCRLYESHHLYVYQCVVNISFALFLPLQQATEQDEPVEDMLSKVNDIFKNYPTDLNYQYLDLVFQFFAFEYYHQHGIVKKEREYFDSVNGNLASFLLYNFVTFPSLFLLSKVQRYAGMKKADKLYEENKPLKENYKPDPSDLPNYICYHKYLALSAFYGRKYEEAVDVLNDMRNSVSFISYPHEDFEMKLLMALFYSFINEYDLAENNLKSVERKAREYKDRNYDNIFTFIKMLRLPMKSKTKGLEDKLKEQLKLFSFQNQGEYRIMECLRMDDSMIAGLANLVK